MIAEQAAAKLGEAVAACQSGCALDRARTFIGASDDLIRVGEQLGLTPSQAVGVMDGWDQANGNEMCFRTAWESLKQHDPEASWSVSSWQMAGEHFVSVSYPVDLAEWSDGYSLGQQLCREANSRATL